MKDFSKFRNDLPDDEEIRRIRLESKTIDIIDSGDLNSLIQFEEEFDFSIGFAHAFNAAISKEQWGIVVYLNQNYCFDMEHYFATYYFPRGLENFKRFIEILGVPPQEKFIENMPSDEDDFQKSFEIYEKHFPGKKNGDLLLEKTFQDNILHSDDIIFLLDKGFEVEDTNLIIHYLYGDGDPCPGFERLADFGIDKWGDKFLNEMMGSIVFQPRLVDQLIYILEKGAKISYSLEDIFPELEGTEEVWDWDTKCKNYFEILKGQGIDSDQLKKKLKISSLLSHLKYRSHFDREKFPLTDFGIDFDIDPLTDDQFEERLNEKKLSLDEIIGKLKK